MADKTETKQPETGETTTTLEEALEAGYLGTHPDPEPNESYTVEGVTSGGGGGDGGDAPPADSQQASSKPASKSTSSKPSSS